VSAGKANPADVVDDAVATLKRQAEAIKRNSGGNKAVCDAADAAVADMSKKAASLKKGLASGKTDAGHAIDEALAGVSAAASTLNHASKAADADEAVKGITGARPWAALGSLQPGWLLAAVPLTRPRPAVPAVAAAGAACCYRCCFCRQEQAAQV
jgi:hypothetical protein